MTRRCRFCGITAEESAQMTESICNRDGFVGPHSFVDELVDEEEVEET
jgi:hypothetical protein